MSAARCRCCGEAIERVPFADLWRSAESLLCVSPSYLHEPAEGELGDREAPEAERLASPLTSSPSAPAGGLAPKVSP